MLFSKYKFAIWDDLRQNKTVWAGEMAQWANFKTMLSKRYKIHIVGFHQDKNTKQINPYKQTTGCQGLEVGGCGE